MLHKSMMRMRMRMMLMLTMLLMVMMIMGKMLPMLTRTRQCDASVLALLTLKKTDGADNCRAGRMRRRRRRKGGGERVEREGEQEKGSRRRGEVKAKEKQEE